MPMRKKPTADSLAAGVGEGDCPYPLRVTGNVAIQQLLKSYGNQRFCGNQPQKN